MLNGLERETAHMFATYTLRDVRNDSAIMHASRDIARDMANIFECRAIERNRDFDKAQFLRIALVE